MLIVTAVTTAAKLKVGFVVLMGFCSLVSGECGLLGSHPDNSPVYKTRTECIKAAAALDADVKKQAEVLQAASSPGPWSTHAVCGSQRDAAVTAAFLRELSAADAMRHERTTEEPAEAPGDRDPYPNGG
jgi:hypothetical protein